MGSILRLTNLSYAQANVAGWQPSPNDTNAGSGQYGACCNEMDIWEANSISSAYTPHVCNVQGQVRCDNPVDCGDGNANRYNGICDKDGCDFNSFRMGDTSFLGPGKTVDTTKKITVVTQFITSNNQSSGDLVEIRRVYVQDGRVIPNSKVNIAGMSAYDSVTDAFCTAQKQVFNDQNSFGRLGGLKAMGESLRRGMVLVLSLWDDHAANMLWLDSNYPLDRDASQPGVARGTCPTSSGKPTDVESQSPNAQVTYSNIRWGPIGSTYTSGGGGTNPGNPGGSPGTPTTTSSAAQQTRWGQCGGNGYT